MATLEPDKLDLPFAAILDQDDDDDDFIVAPPPPPTFGLLLFVNELYLLLKSFCSYSHFLVNSTSSSNQSLLAYR